MHIDNKKTNISFLGEGSTQELGHTTIISEEAK